MIIIAQRRMFSLKIIDTDMFLDMPVSARLLYYDLSMRADDDGFVASPKKIQRMIGSSDDDLRLLMAKRFIIPFDSGICVIKHWRIHNYIRGDRYTETIYKDEKAQLIELDGAYEKTNVIPNGNQMSYQMDTQVRLGKDRLGKVKEEKIKYDTYVSMTEEEYQKLINQYGEAYIKERIIDLNLWKGSKGKTTKSDYMTLLTWIRKDTKGGKLNETTNGEIAKTPRFDKSKFLANGD